MPINTATETAPPSPTRIQPATATQSPTFEQPPPPSLPQQVDVVVATLTIEADAILEREFEPTLTALPTLDETEVARLLATPPPGPIQSAPSTTVPTVQAPAVAPAATPLERTAQAAADVFNPTPSDATPPAQVGLRDLPPSLTATRFQPTVAVSPELIQPTLALVSVAPTFSGSSASAYQFNVGPGQVFTFQNIQLGDGVRLFLPNPVDSNSWIRTDQNGILRYKPLGVPEEGVMSVSPFHEGFFVPSIDQNKNRIVELDWSADGQQFSFRIAPPGGTSNPDAGVWFWQPIDDPTHRTNYMIIRDCPAEGQESCDLVDRVGPFWHWQTRAVEWSPIPGNSIVLLTVRLTNEGRNALAIAQAVRDRSYANKAPQFKRYDYGHWNPDGQSIIVSGRNPDNRIVIAVVNSSFFVEQVILERALGELWLRNAVRHPNGQYYALGRPGLPGSGPVALYDGRGSQISPFIGGAAPEDVRWFPDRSVVVVSVQGRQYAVQVEGGIVTDVTDQLSDPQFSASPFASAAIPAGVVEGQAYTPGQQLRTVIPLLNMRQSPSTSGLIFGQLVEGDYVAILAGPHRSEGYPWWQVQSADGIVGWIAGVINGLPTIRQP